MPRMVRLVMSGMKTTGHSIRDGTTWGESAPESPGSIRANQSSSDYLFGAVA